MIKILHTADWHIGDFTGPVHDGQNVRAIDTRKCIEKLVDVASEEMPDIVMISGDIFHQARVWGNRALDEVGYAINYISSLSLYSKLVVVLRGTPNHDGEEQFKMLEQYFENVPTVEIVTEPKIVHYIDMDIACIPGFDRGVYRAKFPGLSKDEENKVFTDELNNICIGLKAACRENVPTALMAHYTVPGCNSESGQVTFLQQFEPVLSSEAVVGADYDIVCLGHIHRPQMLPNVKNCYYSGAVNAMNFNDEGQQRGFWIHEFDNKEHIDSRIITTPYREFYTIRLCDDDVELINTGAYDMVATQKWRGEIDNKIVRVLYTCSIDNNKALNKAVLEKQLLDDGAFYVWEITPAQLSVNVDKQNMGTKTDPEENLRKFLEEKGFTQEQISKLVMKARPIIAEAIASNTTAALTGIFEPISIEVRNYRNYVDEKFDFTDISFCTINGQNGAGKSSLFMDAIIDCLYEEPREGDLTGWIRNDEKARSGSICFTFKIGEKTFRVTRTRARSGKGTLNLAEFVNGEWEDRSKEKYRDTQEDIVQLLGMDSLTFKSCALIMQDQYGLFLQAPKEERMNILGNLLGLGIYSSMEEIAWKNGKKFGAMMRDTKQEVGIHEATISAYGNPDGEIEEKRSQLSLKTTVVSEYTRERDAKNVELLSLQESKDRAQKIQEGISLSMAKKSSLQANKEAQERIVNDCNTVLGIEETIVSKACEYRALEMRKQELLEGITLFNSKKSEVDRYNAEIMQIEQELSGKRNALATEQQKMKSLEPSADDEMIISLSSKYSEKKADMDAMQSKAVEYSIARNNVITVENECKRKISELEAEYRACDAEREACVRKTALLAESGCVDIDNANCKFLQDAIEAKKRLDTEFPSKLADISARLEIANQELITKTEEAKSKLDELGYDEAAFASLKAECVRLFPYVERAKEIESNKSRYALSEASVNNIQSNISDIEKRLDTVKLEAQRATSELEKYRSASDEDAKISAEMNTLRHWIDTEKQLPVLRERSINATQRISEIELQITELESEIASKNIEYATEISKTTGLEEKQEEVRKLNLQIDSVNSEIKDLQMAIGALDQKIKDIEKIKDNILQLQDKVKEYSKETADYDLLKAAFSQDGIPHQIIRSIIPQLTDTANNILGQMTGGKMGIEFRTEKTLKSNSKKEVVTLDILIEEYGKTTLPYLSKSGGEKVKASLSVILALAEIKSSSAGIQLGMLFIDEPPFLDGDGIQAYCDALETIQNRYPGLKVMAITHDPTMKARFPQSLDVIKTDEGSKVIY